MERWPNQRHAVPMGAINPDGQGRLRPRTGWGELDLSLPNVVRAAVVHFSLPRPSRTVFHGHVFSFRGNLTSWQRRRTATVAMLREPMVRLASEWAYAKTMLNFMRGRAVISGPLLQLSGARSLPQCLVDSDCFGNLRLEWWCSKMTAFLCGMGPLCTDMTRPLSREAIDLAKHNLEHELASFGILEQRDEFLRTLEKRLPTFFEGLSLTNETMEADSQILNLDGMHRGIPYDPA
eukprot:FR736710.1.p1 GENE.FR736710.1~~FR736710.1.p1  ORF type:complete len:263 (+),score=22.67 FR736710.1:87-791(+)